jgi:hypothetical protein
MPAKIKKVVKGIVCPQIHFRPPLPFELQFRSEFLITCKFGSRRRSHSEGRPQDNSDDTYAMVMNEAEAAGRNGSILKRSILRLWPRSGRH